MSDHTEHLIIVHAYVEDEDGHASYYGDYPELNDNPILWTAYERYMIDGEDQPDTWEMDANTFAEIIDAAYAKAVELGDIEIRVEHEPDEIFA